MGCLYYNEEKTLCGKDCWTTKIVFFKKYVTCEECKFQTVFGILAENIKDYDEQEHFKEWLDFERDKL